LQSLADYTVVFVVTNLTTERTRMEELEILNFEETDDGGAIMHVSMSPLAVKVCVEQGILTMIKRYIDDEARSFHARKDEDGRESMDSSQS